MKKISLLMLMFALVFTLAACNSGSTGGGGAETGQGEGTGTGTVGHSGGDSAAGEPVTVTFSYWGSDFDKARMEAIKELFDQEYPHIEVNLIQLPGGDEYVQKQLVMMAGGESYDVIQFAEDSYSFAARGTLEDLTPYIERDPDINLDDYYEVAVKAYTHNGKVYGIPLRVGSSVLYYNKNLFDKHNLDYPNENWTWDDVLHAAQQITDHDEGIFGLDRVGDWWASSSMFLHSFGGSVLSEDRKQFAMDTPESLAAVAFMQDLIWKYDVSPSAVQYPEGIDLWTSGRIGMKLDGPWHVLSNQENITDFDWDITIVPGGKAPIFSNAFHISKTSKNKDAAWEVVKFFTGEKAQNILAKEHGDVPTMISVAESPAYLDLGGKPPENFAAMLTALEQAFEPEVTIMFEEINSAVGEGLGRILDQNLPIDEIMPGIRKAVEELLEEAAGMEALFESE